MVDPSDNPQSAGSPESASAEQAEAPQTVDDVVIDPRKTVEPRLLRESRDDEPLRYDRK